MLWATHQQLLDPLGHVGVPSPYSNILSTVCAALPVVVLFYLLVVRRWLPHYAGAVAAVAALLVAVCVYFMNPLQALMSFGYGAGFGLLPVGWTILCAMLLYNITVRTGQFDIIRRSVASLSPDARVQAILIAFSFGAFLEGAAGGGTPVAICGAIMVGLGFHPFQAAVLCLIANTSPVAYGGLGTPLLVLGGVTGIPAERLSVMAGHQLPILSLLVPAYMVKCMCNWKQTWEVWPCLLVAGGSFAVFQYFFATSHQWIGTVLFPMTDIGGGIFSLVVTAIFLRYWKPPSEMRFDAPPAPAIPTLAPAGPAQTGIKTADSPVTATPGAGHSAIGHDAEAELARALVGELGPHGPEKPLTPWNVSVAWMPFVLMSAFLMLTGLVRQQEPGAPGKPHVEFFGIKTNYLIPVPMLDEQAKRDEYLNPTGETERAVFNFAWLTAPGTAVFFAAILSIFLLRMNWGDVVWAANTTFTQMTIPIPTIAFMLGLSYVTRYSGMDATLGLAFAATGLLYPFFAPLLGWLGVFLTGTDAGSNALFGSLQQITARQVYMAGGDYFQGLDQAQVEVLICTSNSTGGVMGKMIDAQSIVVATAATNQLGKEADIFKAVLWHSIFLACVVGAMTLLQAYVVPFTAMVP